MQLVMLFILGTLAVFISSVDFLVRMIIYLIKQAVKLTGFFGVYVLKLWREVIRIGDLIDEKTASYYRGFIKSLTRKRRTKKLPKIPRHLSIFTKLKYFVFGFVFSAIFVFLPLFFFLTLEDLPSLTDLSLDQVPQTTKIYDRNHVLLYEIYANQNRTVVPLPDIPVQLKQATIAIEDKNFYKNPGIDFAAIARAGWADLTGKPLQGGSTITQQLVKVSLLSPRQSLMRKVQEVMLSVWSEKVYTKDQILELYLNRVPYGGTAWGVEAASEIYFGKQVHDLDLAESAFLAGLPQAPTELSPFGDNPDLWKQRQAEVLTRMKELGYIDDQQTRDAVGEKLNFKPPQVPFKYPHFVMYVKQKLIDEYGLPAVEKGGLQVVTTLDSKLQDMTQKDVTDEINKEGYLGISNGASMVTDPKNGDILAMVGGADYNNQTSGNVNLTTALRQPGSSIKIVTYSAALSHGYTAATPILDGPATFISQGAPAYSPVNYDGRFHGNVPLRYALANSFNIPAVKVLQSMGMQTFLDTAKQMGITTFNQPQNYGLSITLGGAEVTMIDMMNVYGTVANQGLRVDLNPFLKVTDAKGNVLQEKRQVSSKRVLDGGITYILSDILADNNARSLEFGPNSPLLIPGKTVSVKTGTTDNKKDNWTFGYTPSYLVGVWVGNNDGTPMNPALASGITGAAPIWHDIMSQLLANRPDEHFPRPSDIVDKPCYGHVEYFIAGTESNLSCATPIVSGTILNASPTPVRILMQTQIQNSPLAAAIQMQRKRRGKK